MATHLSAWSRVTIASTAATVLCLTGCHAYHPYGYGGYGGTYAVPQGPYVPQGAMLSPAPHAQLQPVPSTAYTETLAPQPGPGPVPSMSVENPSRTLPDSLMSDTPVPQPLPRRADSPPANSLTDPDADSIMTPTIDPASAQLESPSLETFVNDTGEDVPHLGNEEFVQEPNRLKQSLAPPLGNALTEDEPSPFDFDSEQYSWLRGFAEFDPQLGVWRIQYASDQFADQYSGLLTIAPDPRMDTVLNKDVVLLRGRIDNSRRDKLGKPMFVLLPRAQETEKIKGVMRLQRARPRRIQD